MNETDTIKSMARTLWGNGRPGLEERVTRIEQTMIDSRQITALLITSGVSAIAAIIAALIGAWAVISAAS